jgi:hypothetical protein
MSDRSPILLSELGDLLIQLLCAKSQTARLVFTGVRHHRNFATFATLVLHELAPPPVLYYAPRCGSHRGIFFKNVPQSSSSGLLIFSKKVFRTLAFSYIEKKNGLILRAATYFAQITRKPICGVEITPGGLKKGQT